MESSVDSTINLPKSKRSRITRKQHGSFNFDPIEISDTEEENNTPVQLKSSYITQKDLKRLEGTNWLNDNILDYYGQLIEECSDKRVGYLSSHWFSTFYKPQYKKQYKYIEKWVKHLDFKKLRVLLFPVNVNGAHWCLGIINFSKRRLIVYDSLYGRNSEYNRIIFLMKCLLENRGINDKGWTQITCSRPSQFNGNDCGVFVAQYMKYTALGKEPNFKQKDIPSLRLKMRNEIEKKKLLI